MPVIPHATFDSLVEALISDGWMERRDTPDPQPVVIPSVSFSDYLQLRLADRAGVCMGLSFVTSRSFVTQVQGTAGKSEWNPDRLAWHLLPKIDAYADPLGGQSPSSRDRLALASSLADQLDQYAHFRPEIIRSWLAGKPHFPASAPAIVREKEAWQRQLFRELRESIPARHPVEILDALRTDAAFPQRLRKTYPRLLVLGSGVLDPLLVEMLGHLTAAGGDVSVHLILPSMEYLASLHRNRTLPDEDTDLEEAPLLSGHPLLTSMGRHAIGSFLLLGKLDEQYTHWPEPGRFAGPRATLLQNLQSDIRSALPPGQWKKAATDHSLQIHSCFGPRREMETVRDEILRAFAEIPDLKPWEIHIVAPSLEVYAPLVTAVLDSGEDPLPVRLTTAPAGIQEPILEGALALLDLAGNSRFEASRLLALFQLRAVQTALGITDDDKSIERLRHYVIESGLTQGLGEAARPEPGTWIFARDRLLAGSWFGPETSTRYPDGTYALPVADELEGDRELRSRFLSWHWQLELALREWLQPAPPAEWADRLARAATELLGGLDETLLALQPHLAFLRDLDCPMPIDAGTALDWLAAQTGQDPRRTMVSGRIAIGLFRHLQNLPCRVLILMGLQEGAFPGQHRPPAWDLLPFAPRAWDRNARIDDRQLFLDALLAPTERLIITASTRNVRTRKTEPFCSCVDELLRAAEAMGTPRRELIVEHRLQPFAPEYFTGPLPRSYNAPAAKIADLLAHQTPPQLQPFWMETKEVPPAKPGDLTAHQLIEFWKNPAAAFLKAAGIRPSREEIDDEDWDRLATSLDSLQVWKLQDAILNEVVFGHRELERVSAALQANRGLAPGALGHHQWEEQQTKNLPLANAIRAKLGDEEILQSPEISGRHLVGKIRWTHSRSALLSFRAGKLEGPKYLLEPWIKALLASAAGQPATTEILDSIHSEKSRELPAISPEEAIGQLDYLITGYLEGQTRPLGYAPETSAQLASDLDANNPEPFTRAKECWNREPFQNTPAGEGFDPAARIAWRDRDIFADSPDWEHWARVIAQPLQDWSK